MDIEIDESDHERDNESADEDSMEEGQLEDTPMKDNEKRVPPNYCDLREMLQRRKLTKEMEKLSSRREEKSHRDGDKDREERRKGGRRAGSRGDQRPAAAARDLAVRARLYAARRLRELAVSPATLRKVCI